MPIGQDRIFWNAHRVYGRIRFPMLIENWEIIDSWGFKEEDFNSDVTAYQPVFVLKNK